MLKTMMCAAAVCVSAGAAAQGVDYANDAELLIGAFETIHPGFARYAGEIELERAAEALRGVAAGGPSDGEFYLAVQKYLATLRCEHTEAELPAGLAERLAATMLPVDFEYAPDAAGDFRAIVVGVAEGVEGVNAGDELVAVNGRAMGEVFDAVSPYIAVDGFTDHTKTTLFAGTDDIGLTTFDVLFPLLFGDGDGFTLLVESAEGDRREVIAEAINEAESLAMRGAKGQTNFSDDGAVRWEMLDDRTAGLWVNTFVNYRTPVDANEVFAKVFAAMNASGAERLVYDLRLVGGGSADVHTALLAHLITEPISVGGPSRVRAKSVGEYRPYLRSWAQGVFDIPEMMFAPDGEGMFVVNPMVGGGSVSMIRPAEDAWRGELVVLCGPNNESGATILLSELRWQRDVTYVGEPTGGSAEGPTAGILAFMTLPGSKVVARLPLLRSRTSAPEFVEGMGIAPDVLAPVTVESLRAGIDPAMRAALATE
ncbi:MAG: S41 family peptidase [Planctomycetota bacterium]